MLSSIHPILTQRQVIVKLSFQPVKYFFHVALIPQESAVAGYSVMNATAGEMLLVAAQILE